MHGFYVCVRTIKHFSICLYKTLAEFCHFNDKIPLCLSIYYVRVIAYRIKNDVMNYVARKLQDLPSRRLLIFLFLMKCWQFSVKTYFIFLFYFIFIHNNHITLKMWIF